MLDIKDVMSLVLKKAGLKSIESDSEYKELSAMIAKESDGEEIHINTLKRLYGKIKVKEDYCPSAATRKRIAQFLRCESWEELDEYIDRVKDMINDNTGTMESQFVSDTNMSVRLLGLKEHDVIKVYYYPNRMIEAEFIDRVHFKEQGAINTRWQFHFRVMNSIGSLLQHNDEFTVDNFIVGKTFSVDHIRRGGKDYQKYVAAFDHVIQKVEINNK